MLSARAPSMKVKLKLMREIAEEHNVEWDATHFELEYSKPPEDLLVSCVFYASLVPVLEKQNSKAASPSFLFQCFFIRMEPILSLRKLNYQNIYR